MITSWSVTTNYDAYIIGDMANSKNRRNNGNNHRRSMQRRWSGLKYREKMARKQSSHQRHGDESLHGSSLDKLQEFIDKLTVHTKQCSGSQIILNGLGLHLSFLAVVQSALSIFHSPHLTKCVAPKVFLGGRPILRQSGDKWWQEGGIQNFRRAHWEKTS